LDVTDTETEFETEVEAIPWKCVEDMEVCSMHSRWPQLVWIECQQENPTHSCLQSSLYALRCPNKYNIFPQFNEGPAVPLTGLW